MDSTRTIKWKMLHQAERFLLAARPPWSHHDSIAFDQVFDFDCCCDAGERNSHL